MKIRPAAVAGYFYFSEKKILLEYLHNLFEQMEVHPGKNRPKCLIVPHAGYTYSGYTAMKAFALLKPYANEIKNIILIGPSHRVFVDGLALSGYDFFETPLGTIPVNKELRDKILSTNNVAINDEAHAMEHSIEVQLPFLQYVLENNFSILPIVCNAVSPESVAEALQYVWDEPNSLIVVSSDLSHYQTYENANKIDQKTCSKIISLDYAGIEDYEACGNSGIKGLLYVLQKRNMKLECIDHRNSGDTGGGKDKVVGYASFCA